MNTKQFSIATLVLLAVFSIGRFTAPTKIETREVVNTDKRVDTNIEKQQQVVEVIREIFQVDGTRIKETRTETDTQVQTERQRNSVTVRESSKKAEVRPSYRVGGIYQPAIPRVQSDAYGLILEKRLFSELYVGVLATSDKTVALTVSFGF